MSFGKPSALNPIKFPFLLLCMKGEGEQQAFSPQTKLGISPECKGGGGDAQSVYNFCVPRAVRVFGCVPHSLALTHTHTHTHTLTHTHSLYHPSVHAVVWTQLHCILPTQIFSLCQFTLLFGPYGFNLSASFSLAASFQFQLVVRERERNFFFLHLGWWCVPAIKYLVILAMSSSRRWCHSLSKTLTKPVACVLLQQENLQGLTLINKS